MKQHKSSVCPGTNKQIILLVPGVSYRVGKGIHIRGCSFNAKWWKFYWNCTGNIHTILCYFFLILTCSCQYSYNLMLTHVNIRLYEYWHEQVKIR